MRWTWTNLAQSQNTKCNEAEICRVLLQSTNKFFLALCQGSIVQNNNKWHANSVGKRSEAFTYTGMRPKLWQYPLARCVVPCLKTATDLPLPEAGDKDTLSTSGNMPGDAKSGIEQRARVCVCAVAWVFEHFVLVWLATGFKPRCIRTGALGNLLFACIACDLSKRTSCFCRSLSYLFCVFNCCELYYIMRATWWW